jgi:putative transcriptional regulator
MLTSFCHTYVNFLLQFKTLKKEELAKKIGKRIVQLREKKGWTQIELSRACMKDKQSIERIESGNTNPTVFTLYEVANALEVPLADIMKI